MNMKEPKVTSELFPSNLLDNNMIKMAEEVLAWWLVTQYAWNAKLETQM